MHKDPARTDQLLGSEKPSFDIVHYTFTLAPGVVKYLSVTDFLAANVERLIEILVFFTPQAGISISLPYPGDRAEWSDPSRNANPYHSGFNLPLIDKLVADESWDNKLRFHHQVGELYRNRGVPSYVYYCFHKTLGLEQFEADRCLESWVREAWQNDDLTESFRQSPQHLIVTANAGYPYWDTDVVFLNTPFVLERLAFLAAEADRAAKQKAEDAEREAKRQSAEEAARKADEDLDRLRKSSYHTYVYLMEDLRNGHFKIGRSKMPGKRERTLQSEVPQILLRFSIPADEEHEKTLHEHFGRKRLRGEWFSLGAEEVLWAVSFLRRNGDVARASVDYQWLGMVYFNIVNPAQPEPRVAEQKSEHSQPSACQG